MANHMVGQVYPYVVVTSPEQTEFYLSMGYKGMNEKAFREAKKVVADVLAGNKPQRPDNLVEHWNFKDKKGSYLPGNFVSSDGNGSVTIQTPTNNKSRKINLSNHTSGCLKYVEKLAGAPKKSEEAEETTVVYEIENWENTKGKVISGKFVKLDGDKITLELKTKKQTTFSLDLLSDASQKKAQEYGEKENK